MKKLVLTAFSLVVFASPAFGQEMGQISVGDTIPFSAQAEEDDPLTIPRYLADFLVVESNFVPNNGLISEKFVHLNEMGDKYHDVELQIGAFWGTQAALECLSKLKVRDYSIGVSTDDPDSMAFMKEKIEDDSLYCRSNFYYKNWDKITRMIENKYSERLCKKSSIFSFTGLKCWLIGMKTAHK